MENVIAMSAIIGLINGVKLFENPDKRSFFYFCAALLVGLLFGYLKLFGLNIESGILAALSSSGLYTVAKRIGGM